MAECLSSSAKVTDLRYRLLAWLRSHASGTFPLNLNLFGLGTVVFVVLLEPVVLQGLVRRDALLGIVDEDLLEKIEEFAVEFVVGWDDFLKRV